MTLGLRAGLIALWRIIKPILVCGMFVGTIWAGMFYADRIPVWVGLSFFGVIVLFTLFCIWYEFYEEEKTRLRGAQAFKEKYVRGMNSDL